MLKRSGSKEQGSFGNRAVFVDEIKDCIGALIKVSPSDLFIEYGNHFDMVQERIRHKSLSHEHEHLVLCQVSP